VLFFFLYLFPKNFSLIRKDKLNLTYVWDACCISSLLQKEKHWHSRDGVRSVVGAAVPVLKHGLLNFMTGWSEGYAYINVLCYSYNSSPKTCSLMFRKHSSWDFICLGSCGVAFTLRVYLYRNLLWVCIWLCVLFCKKRLLLWFMGARLKAGWGIQTSFYRALYFYTSSLKIVIKYLKKINRWPHIRMCLWCVSHLTFTLKSTHVGAYEVVFTQPLQLYCNLFWYQSLVSCSVLQEVVIALIHGHAWGHQKRAWKMLFRSLLHTYVAFRYSGKRIYRSSFVFFYNTFTTSIDWVLLKRLEKTFMSVEDRRVFSKIPNEHLMDAVWFYYTSSRKKARSYWKRGFCVINFYYRTIFSVG
jgi:hypothetical protein